ncbi:FUSC family protein [Thermobifida cellulosilytica]|uniref:Fusaric acid resistance-like family protein n=1 Tax=Thermobifida cellulosilytica TB100 TaxID=665004 RepID=A0A147KI75_THECS|nr:FUSC family protein [Thermobifida cellulosilytica]KUP96993.1 fusaric acid resistance -like family protein [Thermobifida cellulosilytica TB100]
MRLLGALLHAGRRWLTAELPAVRDRLTENFWPVVHAVVAGTVAWLLAKNLTTSHDPFFAPIAAVIALNASASERGANAVRLLLGVVIGILVGELTLFLIGADYRGLAVAIGVAMALAIVVNFARLVIGQAAVSAMLIVTFAEEASLYRLADALIGAGVALVISQLLFPVRVVAILRRAEADALAEMARMLEDTGKALAHDDAVSTEETVDRLGGLSQPIAHLTQTRESSRHTVRSSTIRWGDLEPITREDEHVDRLVYLGESCLTLARTTAAMSTEERHRFAPLVCEIADSLDMLARDLNNPATRQRAVDRALEAARPFGGRPDSDDPLTVSTHLAVLLVSTDIMLFAGIDPQDVRGVLEKDIDRPRVTRATGVPWLPWVSWRPKRPVQESVRLWRARLAEFVSREEGRKEAESESRRERERRNVR